MSRYAAILFRVVMMAFAAMCVADANYFIPSTTLDLGVGTALLASCPEKIQASPAAPDNQIEPNGEWIVMHCLEACGEEQRGEFVRVQREDQDLDWVYIRCPEGTRNRFNQYGQKSENNPIAYEIKVPSTNTCWYCVDGCAGKKCPGGETCLSSPRSPGSDCRRWVCTDPNYMRLADNTETGVPDCWRTTGCPYEPEEPFEPHTYQCVPAEVLLDGPPAIQPGTVGMWTAQALSTGYCGYDYYWYVANHFAGSGESYSGGRPSGVPIGSSWPVRVDVMYNGNLAGSREIYVRESTTAPVWMY